ncbi:hypothetical protein AB835_03770 [Candidatus Endobugula sertula]|uniref:Leucine-binding protein domain-containing protein n=1 Tax=Candidatus Endobugula sertula TaxID=62101 RepID=A0A1D2QS90_9GAMM|nr:hypothetical protein AB835_03770 [Candidatus Endobugula sertula]
MIRGGVNGRLVALKVFDDQGDSDVAMEVANTITSDPDIVLVLNDFGGDHAATISQIYEDAQLPTITASSTDNAITRNKPWVFMLAPNNHFQGVFTAHYIDSVFAAKTVGIIYDASAFGRTLFDSFSQTANTLGMTVNYSRRVDGRQADVDELLEQIAADFNTREQPDILYLATQVKESANLLTLIQSTDNQLRLLCSTECARPKFIDYVNHDSRERAQPGYYSDHLLTVSPFMLDIANQQAQVFYQQFTQEYPAVRLFNRAAYYYDAASLAVAALRKLTFSETNTAMDSVAVRAQIWRALAQRYRYDQALQGVTGALYFDSEGNADSELAVGYYAGQKMIPAPVQYRSRQPKEQLPVAELLSDVWRGDVIMLGDSLLRRTRVVYTGMDIQRVNQLDTVQSQYNLTFYLWFRFSGDFADTDITFEHAVTPIVLDEPLLSQTDNGMTTRVYQVTGDFKRHFPFNDYPFDHQTLPISFHHKTEQADRLLYVNDSLGLKAPPLSKKLLDTISGWQLEHILLFQSRIALADIAPVFYSQFNALIHIKRNAWNVLLKKPVSDSVINLVGLSRLFYAGKKRAGPHKTGLLGIDYHRFFPFKIYHHYVG